MSDVPARCSRCGNEVRVSEFIAPEALKCPNCSSQMLLDKSTLEKAPERLTVRREKPPTPQSAEPGEATKSTLNRQAVSRHRRRANKMRKVGKVRISDYAISWAIFFTLTPVLCLLRYVDFLPESDMKDYVFYGQIAFVVFYLVVLVEAFGDEMFDGILCAFLPPYTAFFLFFKSNSFILRAVIIALLAAFGYDLAITSYESVVWAYKEVSYWIQEGALN